MLPRFYNKRLKFHLPLIIITVCVLLSVHNILFSHVNQHELDQNSLNLVKFSNFNPKYSTLNLINYIQNSNTNGDNQGIYFHWDDWLDTYPANSILENYKLNDSECLCSDDMIKFADVNGYWLESYNKKVLRGMTNLFCSKPIPEKIYLTTDTNYIEVPVKGKKRFGYEYDTTQLIPEFEKINNKTTQLETISIKPFSKDKMLRSDDFYFDPDYEILKLKETNQISGLSEEQHKYLQFLKYANNIVDNSDRYFKYPWIITDIVQGNSHHLAYPFFKRFISTRERQSIIQHLVKSWFQFAESIEVASWINYGSLLGWAYNGINMPWDTDVDIQLPIKVFDYLAQHYNNTLIVENPKLGNGKFFLDISPTYIKQGNGRNFIDGRFIDINSGLYIDISALSQTNYKPPKALSTPEYDYQTLVHCKNFNWHSLDEILPIRHTYFEGSSVYIPHNISSILSKKYGAESFTSKLKFHDYNYQSDISLWVSDEICSQAPDVDRYSNADHSQLTLEGACDSRVLQDEYRINFKSGQRHYLLNQDIDNPTEYDIDFHDLPMSRKDAWDYFNDLSQGKSNGEWFHEYPIIP